MTLYIVKHGSSDFRVHEDDGSELFAFSDDPMDSDGPERELVESFKAANANADLLGDDSVRPHFIDLITNNWHYRDLTISDETVPWQ